MSTSIVSVTNGPDKSDLLRAVTNSDRQVHMLFDTPNGVIEALIETIEEQGDGASFTVWGHLASTTMRGAFFTGHYNCETRAGRLALKRSG